MSLYCWVQTGQTTISVSDPSKPEEIKLFNEALRLIRLQYPDKAVIKTDTQSTQEIKKTAAPEAKVSPEDLFAAEELGIVERSGRVMVGTRHVARICGKTHNNVLSAIRRLDCSNEFRVLNFERAEYKDAKGHLRPEWFMTKDGFVFLVMGFTGKMAAQFKEAYIKAFNAMEAMLRARELSA